MSGFEGFEEAVKANTHPYYNRGCGVSRLLTSLPDKDAGEVRKVLDDPRYTGSAIYAALATRVIDPPSAGIITRHRGRTCGCFRNTGGAEVK